MDGLARCELRRCEVFGWIYLAVERIPVSHRVALAATDPARWRQTVAWADSLRKKLAFHKRFHGNNL